MAQHPEKLKWKESHPYGLSASQFGMALGFCGRVSDYVHYLRHIVGTEREFKGNEFTAHGISTEPKSRALYELLTGCQVHDGGFFVTKDRILGCSPDGQIYHAADEVPIELHASHHAARPTVVDTLASAAMNSSEASSPDVLARQSSGCSVRVPFKSLRRARSSTEQLHSRTSCDGLASSLSAMRLSSVKVESPTSAATTTPCAASSSSVSSSSFVAPPTRQRVRLLEIKSPFRALYDCTKAGYAPFGIPLHYMCQIQGQLAIANCEECDFFVYLDHPRCQVEGWRVRRSREFWRWAEPSLRQVSEWVKGGPPDWLNRSFAFSPFSFDRIEVAPLVFPYDITAAAALIDARRFAYFAKYPSPYKTLSHHREVRGGTRERNADGKASFSVLSEMQRSVEQWCQDACGASYADLTEYERIALTVQAPVVRHLFNTNDETEGERQDDSVNVENKGEGGVFCQTLSNWRRVVEADGSYEGSPTAALWKALLRTASAGRDPLIEVRVEVPEDWEDGHFTVRCTLPSFTTDANNKDETTESFSDSIAMRFFQRLFLSSLIPAPAQQRVEQQLPSPVLKIAAQRSFATPLDTVPVFSPSPTPLSRS